MREYTYTQARRQLASVLDAVERGEHVRITRQGGASFRIVLEGESSRHPFAHARQVAGAHVPLSTILKALRTGRSTTHGRGPGASHGPPADEVFDTTGTDKPDRDQPHRDGPSEHNG